MNEFTLYNLENAPQASKELLNNSVKSFKMIPNLHAVMAQSPQLLEAYQTISRLFQQSSFNAEELTVVWQSVNVEHSCHYCIPAHTAIAHSMGVSSEIIDALRNKTPLPNEKLEVLRDTTLALVRNRGIISDQEIENFFAKGYKKQQLLDIVLGISQKIMSNYTNHLADTPVDKPFEKFI